MPQAVMPTDAPADDEFDFMPYFLALWRRRWLAIVGATLVVSICAYGSGRLQTPQYPASASLTLQEVPTSGARARGFDVLHATRLLVAEPSNAQEVVDELQLSAPPLGLTAADLAARHLTVDTMSDLGRISIAVTLPSPIRRRGRRTALPS